MVLFTFPKPKGQLKKPLTCLWFRSQRARGRAHNGEAIVELVLTDVVDRNVEAGRVGYVENVKTELNTDTFGEFGQFHDGNVHALLPGLPENIALTGREIGFERITGRNRAIQVARVEQWNREAFRPQSRAIHTVGTGERVFHVAARRRGTMGL